MGKKKEEKTIVAVRPDHMKVLAIVGIKPGLTAEEIAEFMQADVDVTLQALDDLINTAHVRDEDAEYFELTDKGQELYVAFVNISDNME